MQHDVVDRQRRREAGLVAFPGQRYDFADQQNPIVGLDVAKTNTAVFVDVFKRKGDAHVFNRVRLRRFAIGRRVTVGTFDRYFQRSAVGVGVGILAQRLLEQRSSGDIRDIVRHATVGVTRMRGSAIVFVMVALVAFIALVPLILVPLIALVALIALVTLVTLVTRA